MRFFIHGTLAAAVVSAAIKLNADHEEEMRELRMDRLDGVDGDEDGDGDGGGGGGGGGGGDDDKGEDDGDDDEHSTTE